VPYGAFLVQALIISLSGVMAPGPLTVVVVGKGARSPRAGALIALGHGVVEFPLMAAIVVGLAPFFQRNAFAATVGFAGGLVLVWMGLGILRSIRGGRSEERYREVTPFMAGVLMSAGNPYFIVWWATVGATLVLTAWQYGVWQLVVFGVLHWSLDLVWDWFLSSASYRGTKVLGERFLFWVSLVSGVVLLFFGGRFIIDAVGRFRGV
jgi:threonine/homoserine/homoserine lactone efflux protein